MRTRTRPVAIALAALLTTAPAWAAGPRPPARVPPSLDAAEAATLTYMREEEKLARDLYQAMNALWQVPIFENIAGSKQQHTSTVMGFLDKYSLPDPATPDLPGVYTDPAVQQLYTDLVARGEASYLEALRVGGLVEELDIADLDAAIAATDNADLKQMYGNLQQGSRNHLRAFAAEIERLGAVYTAQHLDQSAVASEAAPSSDRLCDHELRAQSLVPRWCEIRRKRCDRTRQADGSASRSRARCNRGALGECIERDHRAVAQGLPGDEPQEIAAMPVAPVRHGGATRRSRGGGMGLGSGLPARGGLRV